LPRGGRAECSRARLHCMSPAPVLPRRAATSCFVAIGREGAPGEKGGNGELKECDLRTNNYTRFRHAFKGGKWTRIRA